MTTSVASMTSSTQQLSRTTRTRDAENRRRPRTLRIILLRGHCPCAVRQMVARPGCRPMPTIQDDGIEQPVHDVLVTEPRRGSSPR